jgi:outer membrane protein assembly factor BamD (BamD/ComL family)
MLLSGRHLILAAVLGLEGVAPLQCSREPDDDLRRYETPPEALYDLATRFRREGDLSAWRRTLGYLVERYPNSRFAVRAKQELEEPGGDGAETHP